MPGINHRKIIVLISCFTLSVCGEKGSSPEPRVFSNPLGLGGHDPCKSEAGLEPLLGGEARVGQCYNELECLASGGLAAGYCPDGPGSNILVRGVCCVHVIRPRQVSTAKYGYIYSEDWPQKQNRSAITQYEIRWRPETCFIRLELLTLELAEKDGNCVHDRFTVIGGKEKGGSLCGDRSGEVTLIEPDSERGDIKIVVMTQSEKWRYNIGVAQISCEDAEEAKMRYKMENADCGRKNPSLNKIGSTTLKGKKKVFDLEKILAKKSAKKVFRDLKNLPALPNVEKNRPQIFRPSFDKQTLDYRKLDLKPHLGRSNPLKARILYGNETDPNEYPWQISMWIDKSHFCGGTLITDQWVVTAAHCVDLQYRRHFSRTTVSLGDHNVKMYNDAKSTFRKIKRIIRFPTYDNNLIDGDLALLHLTDPVELTANINTACLPPSAEETYGFSEAVISGWGYTEKTKVMKPRPMTSDVLREAEVFILPQDLCVKYSPFPISDKMICTFKGPRGVETTCQGDSGGPLVVNEGENKWTVVGATSFGVSTCEGPYPSMFARVSRFLDFIYASMVPSPFEEILPYKTPQVLN